MGAVEKNDSRGTIPAPIPPATPPTIVEGRPENTLLLRPSKDSAPGVCIVEFIPRAGVASGIILRREACIELLRCADCIPKGSFCSPVDADRVKTGCAGRDGPPSA